MEPELLNTREAATYLGLSAISLTKLRSQGSRDNCLPPIPYVRLGGRAVRYRIADLRAYAEKHIVVPDNERGPR